MVGKGETFKIRFEQNWFTEGTILESTSQKVRVITDPQKKWWKILLEYVTFGLYKAPWEYEVEIWKEQK